MKITQLRALALLAVAGCGGSVGKAGVGLVEPSAVAVFHGFTVKNADLHPYLAIASTAKDEVALVDAVDDAPVLSPVLIRPLAVAVPGVRPVHLVSGSLADGKADLLVVVTSGSSALQVIRTWTADNRVEPALTVDLADASPGVQVLAAIAAPVPVSTATGWAPAPGRVRVIVALTGGRLAVVEYTRDAGPDGGIVATAPVVQDLGLDLLSLATNPADPRFVYGATVDPIPSGATTVEGVAELDATGAPGAWTIRGLDARGPTKLVAATRLAERKPDSADDDASAFQALQVDRVYAVLDSAGCGDGERVSCGLAVIDPVSGGIPPDPAGLMPYLAPIAVPAIPLAIAIASPPQAPMAADLPQTAAPYMRIAPATGQRTTTGVAALPASDGKVYYVDLARWAIPNDVSTLRSLSTRTAVTSALPIFIGTSAQQLGFWFTPAATAAVPDPVPRIVTAESELGLAVQLTPGFTTTETWSVVYQGTLPAFDQPQQGQTWDPGDGRLLLAVQVPLAAGGFTEVVRVYDPTLGVHLDDIVRLRTPGLVAPDPAQTSCEFVEARISELVPPDPGHPGGTIALTTPPCVPAPTAEDPNAEDCTEQAKHAICRPILSAPASAPVRLLASVRASKVLVRGQSTGYAGRAEIAATAADPGFELRYENEDALACPLIPWPWPESFTTPPAVPACDAACRAQCERLVLARKARRIYYVSDVCSTGDAASVATCLAAWPVARYPFPRANGPVLAFKVGLEQDPAAPAAPAARELQVAFTTRSGIVPSFRRAPSSAASAGFPLAAVPFDRSPYKGSASYRFFVPYVDGHVLDFSPAEFFNSSVVIR